MTLRGARCPRCGMLRYPGDERIHGSCLSYVDQGRRPPTRTGPIVYFLVVCLALGLTGGLVDIAIGRDVWAALLAGSWVVVPFLLVLVDAYRQLSRP